MISSTKITRVRMICSIAKFLLCASELFRVGQGVHQIARQRNNDDTQSNHN